MKDNYSWLDEIFDNFIDGNPPFASTAWKVEAKAMLDYLKPQVIQTIISQIEIEKLRARIEALEQLVVAGDKNITLTDIYGDDWRNNYGYNETQVRDAANHLKGKFTKVVEKRIADLQEKLKELEGNI